VRRRKGTLVLVLCICILSVVYLAAKKVNPSMAEEVTSPQQNVAPDITLSYLSNTFGFSHTKHMGIAKECVKCHHADPKNPQSCRNCHQKTSTGRIPALKDAYHNTCRGCHSKTAGPTGCLECHHQGKGAQVKSLQGTGPVTFTIGDIANIYQPVKFPHRKHALLVGECTTCHHTGTPSACIECHQKPFDPKNLNMPGIKGAYHRNCLLCHRQAKGPMGCRECHEKKTESKER